MKEFIQNSTIRGIIHIYNASSKIIKLFWIFLFLFGIIGTFVNVYFVVTKYLSNPISSSFAIEAEEFVWPDITFCIPAAPYNFDKPEVYNYWKQVFKSSDRIARILNNSPTSGIFYQNGKEYAKKIISVSTADPQKMKADEFLYRIIEPQFSTSFVESQNIFTSEIHQIPSNVPCSRFHTDKYINAYNIQSFKILLNINNDSYVKLKTSFLRKSVYLYINKENELSGNYPIYIYPGDTNTITIRQVRVSYDNGNKCRTNNFTVELYDSLLGSPKLFEGDFQYCSNVERQMVIVESCNCYNPFLPIYINKTGFPRICFNTTYFSEEEIISNAKCVNNTIYRIVAYNRIRAKCYQYLVEKCNSTSYKIDKKIEKLFESSEEKFKDKYGKYAKLISINKDHHAELMNNFTKYRDKVKCCEEEYKSDFKSKIRSNLVEIEFKKYRDKGDYYEEKYAYRFSELLSDIGGQMGLWLGLSVVGLFEVFQLVFVCFKNICYKTRKVRQRDDYSEPIELTTDNKL